MTQECSRCGGKMVVRNGKFGKFWGCSSFPRCRNTMPYNEEKKEPAPQKEFTPSQYQRAVFDFVKSGQGHAVVEAVAGSGKTTTIVKALSYTDPRADVAFVAFNRHIAKALTERAPAHVHVSTLHSLGFGNIRNALGNVKVEPRKIEYIVKDLQDGMDWKDAERVDQSISSISRLVSLCKSTMLEPTDINLDYISDRWNIETNGDRDLIFDMARRVYRQSIDDKAVIDYDDMIFFCAAKIVPCKKFDLLFVDETQDLNKAQLEMAVLSVKENGRIIAVGDRAQSIYGFRGADTEAVPNIIKRLNAMTLPLSITYRVPKTGVELAKTIVPQIEAAEWAEDGTLGNVSEFEFMDKVRPGDLVLCRTNAPLVGPCFNLIRQGVKAVILGRDIGSGLVALIHKVQKRAKVRSLNDTIEALTEYRRMEVAKMIKVGKQLRADALDDKVETIIALCDGCHTVAEVERKIGRVFSDEAKGVVFSTVHKAKGTEADTVYIMNPQQMPHPKAKEGWEMDQEYNIMYVAWTRHKKALYFIGQDPFS